MNQDRLQDAIPRRLGACFVAFALLVPTFAPLHAHAALAASQLEVDVERAREEIRQGDTATDLGKHNQAILHYERALEILIRAPKWAAQANELRGSLSHAHQSWFRVVGDVSDLRKAIEFGRAYVNGLDPGATSERALAREEVQRLAAELEELERPQPSPLDHPGADKPHAHPAPRVVGPAMSVAPPAPCRPADSLTPQQKGLKTAAIVTGSLGWAALAGAGLSYGLYSYHYDKAMGVFEKDALPVTREQMDDYYRHRDRWRSFTLVTGVISAVSFSVATGLLWRLSRSKTRKRLRMVSQRTGLTMRPRAMPR